MSAESGKPRPFYKNPWLLAFLGGAIALTLLRPMANQFKSAPPPLLSPGPWQLIGDDGKPFTSETLKGQVYIADFFFTTCPTICPALTKQMKKLNESMGPKENLRFVSFSVDPDTDTPEKLRAYREKFGIDADNWTLVTSSTREEMHQVLAGQMKLHVGEKEPIAPAVGGKAQQGELYEISHIGKFALFDQNGDLRALATTDSHGLTRIAQAAELLLERGP
jgi:protein SCO1/2